MRLRSSVLVTGVLLLAAAGAVVGVREARVRQQAERRAEMQLQRGIALYDRRDYVHAELELRRALRADPGEWRAPYYVGVIQIARRRYGLAIPYLERALALNPEEPKILRALGVTYFKLDRLDMAKGYFSASVDVDPSDSESRNLVEKMASLQRRAMRVRTVEN